MIHSVWRCTAQVGIPAFAAVILAAPSPGVALRRRNGIDRLRRRPVRPRDFDSDDEPGSRSPERPRSGRVGRSAYGASAAGVAIALGGVIRDVVAALSTQDEAGARLAYNSVYGLEIVPAVGDGRDDYSPLRRSADLFPHEHLPSCRTEAGDTDNLPDVRQPGNGTAAAEELQEFRQLTVHPGHYPNGARRDNRRDARPHHECNVLRKDAASAGAAC